MSGSVGSAIYKSDTVDNFGEDVGIASPSLSRSNVISTSGLYCRHVEFTTWADIGPCRPMSANVGSDRGWSGMVETVGVAVGIASPSLSVQKLLPVFIAAILRFRRQPMSGHVGQCRAMSTVSYQISDLVENMDR